MDDKLERDTERERNEARREFYRIVAERLDARIARGEVYTSTSDLSRGYESLHARGFDASVPPSQSVAQVLGYARYKGRLFYARHVVTHKAERAGTGRTASHRLYLRPDAIPPTDHVLVPIEAHGDEIAEYIAIARGVPDSTVHVMRTPDQAPSAPILSPAVDFEALAIQLTEVIKAQAEVIDRMVPALSALRGHAA